LKRLPKRTDMRRKVASLNSASACGSRDMRSRDRPGVRSTICALLHDTVEDTM